MTTQTDPDSAASAAFALKTTMAGAASLSIGGFTDSQIAMLGGLVIGVCGLLLQAYLGGRRDRREEREHRARMRALAADATDSAPL